jgi:hypothetical protein
LTNIAKGIRLRKIISNGDVYKGGDGTVTKFAVTFILVPEDGREILKWVSSKESALMCNGVQWPKIFLVAQCSTQYSI